MSKEHLSVVVCGHVDAGELSTRRKGFGGGGNGNGDRVNSSSATMREPKPLILLIRRVKMISKFIDTVDKVDLQRQYNVAALSYSAAYPSALK